MESERPAILKKFRMEYKQPSGRTFATSFSQHHQNNDFKDQQAGWFRNHYRTHIGINQVVQSRVIVDAGVCDRWVVKKNFRVDIGCTQNVLLPPWFQESSGNLKEVQAQFDIGRQNVVVDTGVKRIKNVDRVDLKRDIHRNVVGQQLVFGESNQGVSSPAVSYQKQMIDLIVSVDEIKGIPACVIREDSAGKIECGEIIGKIARQRFVQEVQSTGIVRIEPGKQNHHD